MHHSVNTLFIIAQEKMNQFSLLIEQPVPDLNYDLLCEMPLSELLH